MTSDDKLAAAKACNRATPGAKPGPKQNCADVVNISVYFDGTGNNKTVDESLHRWANPARLWRAAQMLREPNNYPIYVSGVGTPFNGTATNWLDQAEIATQDAPIVGGTAGAGGTRRTEFGQSNVNDSLRLALIRNAKKLNISLTPYSETGRADNLPQMRQAMADHRLTIMINLSVFGFSRGAALARAFVNDMVRQFDVDEHGGTTYNGFPIRINFMGLFDTVASFGIPSLNVDTPFSEKNLVVPKNVERCVHYVAAHEIRFSFPVDLIRKDGKLHANWTEVAYPGVHSDVGGGYEPVMQQVPNKFARIPMRDMMREALRCGVRMMAYDDLKKSSGAIFNERFAVDPHVDASFKAYMGAVHAGGTMEQSVAAHMKALYSAWGTMTRKKIMTPDLVEAQGSKAMQYVGNKGIAHEAELYLDKKKGEKYFNENLLHGPGTQAIQFYGRVYSQIVRPERWRLEAWQATASPAIVEFIRHNVHDSKAGFLLSLEPFSYFRPRGMAESNRNVLAPGYDWLCDARAALKKGVIKVFHLTEGVVVEIWEMDKLISKTVYKVGTRIVVATVRAGVKFSVEVYQGTKSVVISTLERGEQLYISSVDTASKAMNEAGRQIREGTGRVVDGAKDAARSAGKALDEQMHSLEDGWLKSKSMFGL